MIRLFQISVPFIAWSLVWAACAFGYETSIRITGGDKANVFCIAPSCPPCPVCPVCPKPQCVYTYSDWGACTNGTQTRTVIFADPVGCVGTPVTQQSCSMPPPNIPALPDRSVNFMLMSYYQTRLFSFTVLSDTGMQIGLANQYQLDPSNVDMLVKYSGPTCGSNVPTLEEMEYVRNGGQRSDLFAEFSSLSFEVVDIYKPILKAGCYYILLAEKGGFTNQSTIRLTVADATYNPGPPPQVINW